MNDFGNLADFSEVCKWKNRYQVWPS